MQKRALSWGAFVCVVVLAGLAVAQEQKQPSAEEAAAMMAAMMPGAHHEALMKNAGNWETKTKMWMQPGAPPTESTGTATLESVMGGRFLLEVSQTNMMGMPWEGRGVFGYDNVTKKHLATWYDSFGTTIMSFEGDCEKSCGVVTMQGQYMDPMTKSMKKMKYVSKQVDADHVALEVYDVAQDGAATKIVEVGYARKK